MKLWIHQSNNFLYKLSKLFFDEQYLFNNLFKFLRLCLICENIFYFYLLFYENDFLKYGWYLFKYNFYSYFKKISTRKFMIGYCGVDNNNKSSYDSK